MKSKKWISYLLIIVVITILTFFVYGCTFINQAKKVLYDEKVNYMKEISIKTSQNVQSYINGYLTTVDAISSFISIHDPYDTKHILEMLQAEAEKNDFKRMGIISPDGTAVTTDGLTLELADRPYFERAMQGKSTVSNELLVDKADGAEINVIASPVYYEGEVVQVIFATKTQEGFSNLLQMESFNGEGYSYIITSDGNAAVKTNHPSSIQNYTNLFDEIHPHLISDKNFLKMKEDIANGQAGTFENKEVNKKTQVYYTKVGINDWWLVSVVPSESISQKSDKLIMELTFFTIIVVLLVSSLSITIMVNMNRSNKKLEHIAYTDKVTGFSNWHKFCIDAKNNLEKNKNIDYAMVSIDVKKFSVLNDLFGHNMGDSTLQFIANIISADMQPMETFARASMDKFAIMMEYKNKRGIIDRIEQLSAAVKNLIESYTIELSAGVYLIEEKNLSIEILNDRANIARNIAKQKNNTYYSFFNEKNRLDILREKEIENVMHAALRSGEFEVYLQPKYSIKTNSIIGAEALVRWNRKEFELIPPDEFIPLFEKNGFIRDLDLYMFEQICSLLSQWSRNEKVRVVPISVNLSRGHLSDKNLPQKFSKIMKRYQVDPKFLEFELTESAIYSDTENMKNMMKRIRALGINISIDDFGSGYSSLGTLKDLPIDVLKLDKSFFDDLFDHENGQSIVVDVLSMSKRLGLVTVAEGIETVEQVEFLKTTECDIIQGYYFSRPVMTEKFEKLIGI